MKKIDKYSYIRVRKSFNAQVALELLPSLKKQGRSKARRKFYQNWAKELGCYEGTIRRVVKSKNYAEYLRLGRENRGTSTKRKPNKNVENVFNEAYENLTKEVVKSWYPEPTPTKSKPKKYKTTIISTEYIPPFLPDEGIESYTVEVLND